MGACTYYTSRKTRKVKGFGEINLTGFLCMARDLCGFGYYDRSFYNRILMRKARVQKAWGDELPQFCLSTDFNSRYDQELIEKNGYVDYAILECRRVIHDEYDQEGMRTVGMARYNGKRLEFLPLTEEQDKRYNSGYYHLQKVRAKKELQRKGVTS